MKTLRDSAARREKGFTLIELLVVVLIIGILAAIAVPQYFKVVERGRFSEATNFFSSLKGAQERYLSRNGGYNTATTGYDITLGALSKFTPSAITVTTTPNWTITLTRGAPTPAGYGAYVLSFIGPAGSMLCNNADCSSDLLP